MLGFFKWFKSGTKMKRWMFLVLLGIVLVCYGIATIMTTPNMSILKLLFVIIISIVGFMMGIIGMIYSQKRVLELLVEDTDDRLATNKKKKDVNVNSLIFDKKVYKEGPKIVVIGGGTGLNTVLKGLKDYTKNLTAIASMTDYGEGRNANNSFMPLEDVRRSIISLSENEMEMERLLKLKFQDNLDFTSVFVSAMQSINGEGSKFIENISKVLNMTGKILPVTLDKMNICAELEDGTVIDEKDKIAEVSMAKISRINRVFISPSNVRPAPRCNRSNRTSRCNCYRSTEIFIQR
ncbi:MAG: YvcK family protein [Clostridia bacterium]|jgi:hypothetical protein|nr:YvcK family protein [Clostridia bacterium]